MTFRPLHDRVVVRRVDSETKTRGGIIIPDTAKEKPQEGEIVAVGRLGGCRTATEGRYPGWTPNPDSPLLALGLDVYRRHFGGEAAVKVIHAGLECGILAGKYPELDMLSFGPNVRGAHSPDERVEIASVAMFWQLLVALLAATPPRHM